MPYRDNTCLDKHDPDMSYSAVDHELNVDESTVCIK